MAFPPPLPVSFSVPHPSPPYIEYVRLLIFFLLLLNVQSTTMSPSPKTIPPQRNLQTVVGVATTTELYNTLCSGSTNPTPSSLMESGSIGELSLGTYDCRWVQPDSTKFWQRCVQEARHRRNSHHLSSCIPPTTPATAPVFVLSMMLLNSS